MEGKMKKLLSLLLILAMVFCFAACGNGGSEEGTNAVLGYDDIADQCESEDGTYAIAMVTDVGNLKDGSFNQYTWNGCKKYAYDNGLTYKYYQPANGANATDEDRIKAMTDACEAGAQIVVAPGFLQSTALETVATQYTEVEFVFIDGWDLGLPNLVGVSYQEEQAGYLAGYAAVMEGFEKLGYSGGGGGTNPACCRYGHGFAQGANDAAAALGKTVEMRYSFDYGASFSASDDLQAMLNGWYQAGTEVCFMCGGTMFNSGVAAAEANDGYIIGVDVDQSAQAAEGTVVTSAMKGLAVSVETALAKFFDGAAVYGGSLVLGAADDAVGLPTETWSLANWSVDDYNALFEQVKSGEVAIDNSGIAAPADMGLANVTFVE